jgi:Gas vesicle protein
MAKRRRIGEASQQPKTVAETILTSDEASLLDVVDNVLNKGVVLTGEITIGLAQIDLVYARLSVLLCAADRVLPSEEHNVLPRRSRRHAARVKAGQTQS